MVAPEEIVAVSAATAETVVLHDAASPVAKVPHARGGRGAIRGRSQRGGGRGRAPRERGEFEQVTIDARRVARDGGRATLQLLARRCHRR